MGKAEIGEKRFLSFWKTHFVIAVLFQFPYIFGYPVHPWLDPWTIFDSLNSVYVIYICNEGSWTHLAFIPDHRLYCTYAVPDYCLLSWLQIHLESRVLGSVLGPDAGCNVEQFHVFVDRWGWGCGFLCCPNTWTADSSATLTVDICHVGWGLCVVPTSKI